MREARHGSVRRRSFTRKAIPPPSPFPRVHSASFNPFPRSPGAGFADPRFAAPQFRQRGQPRSFLHEKVRSSSPEHHRKTRFHHRFQSELCRPRDQARGLAASTQQ